MKNNVIYGRNLLAELAPTVDSPFLLVTMADLWPLFRDSFDESRLRLHLVDSIERVDMDRIIADHPDVRNVVGLGGGQAIDVAKYIAWRAQLPLFQVPTSLSVNAPFAQRAAAREDGVISYVGFKQPETVYIDLDIIQSAPAALNRTGVGDIFCYYTGHADWRLADEAGKCEPKWPLDERQIEEARQVMMSCHEAADDIREVTEHGIRVLVEALRWGGAAFANNGWNPRPIEGSEHTFFYTLEYLTKKHFLHGQPVGLGTILMSLLQEGNDAEWAKDALDRCGVPYLPEDMGVTWEECIEALRYMPTYAEQAGLWYTAATHYEITDEYLARAHELVYRPSRYV
jgi:glycerol dehydrogenase-like iron-containing ADH family enzyme